MGGTVTKAMLVIGMMTATVGAAASPASAAVTRPASAPSAAVAAADYECEVSTGAGDYVNVRSRPGTDSEVEKVMVPGEVLEAQCWTVAGGWYSCDGYSNNRWVPVRLGFFWYGYVARSCVAHGMR